MATKKSKTTKDSCEKNSGKSIKSLLNKLESMEQTTGKEYTDQENVGKRIGGKRSKFGTSNAQVFEENISEMTLVDMQTLTVRVGVMPSLISQI